MATTKKPAEGNGATETTRREKIVGWAELGIETAASAQKQWNDITFAYTELTLKAWRDGLVLGRELLRAVQEDPRRARPGSRGARQGSPFPARLIGGRFT